MCGIVGFTGGVEIELLNRMNQVQTHRGPDSQGIALDPREGVALAARRLRIIDFAHGEQPLNSVSAASTIVFNGEIFNASELRHELREAGIEFRSAHSDTEVVVNMYEHYGPSFVTRLNGMFGFVIYDHAQRLLFGARDRFGIKPLYYSTSEKRFSFASELKALITLPWIDRELDAHSLFQYLSFQAVPAPQSIFRGVRKLNPAETFTYNVRTRECRTAIYWTPDFVPNQNVDSSDAPSRIRTTLEQAVVRWSTSDVRVVSSLSGGIDSALVTAFHAANVSKPATFTLGFTGSSELDERKYASLVASRYSAEHNEIEIGPAEVLADLEDMIWHLDEPYAGGLPSWFIFKEIGKTSKVALTGVGGDELFGNYGKWVAFESLRSRLKSAALRLIGRGRRWPIGSRYHPMIFTDASKRQLFAEDFWHKDIEASERIIESLWPAGLNARDAVTCIDLRQQLPNEFLHMLDRFSMAHSVEARTPFLDHAFVDEVLRLPASIRSADKDHKAVLRASADGLIPDEVLAQPKRGFVIPLAQWLRSDFRHLVEHYLAPRRLRRQGIFAPQVWDAIALPALIPPGLDPQGVWTLLMFQLWHERFID